MTQYSLYWTLPGSKSLQNKFLLFCGKKKKKGHIKFSKVSTRRIQGTSHERTELKRFGSQKDKSCTWWNWKSCLPSLVTSSVPHSNDILSKNPLEYYYSIFFGGQRACRQPETRQVLSTYIHLYNSELFITFWQPLLSPIHYGFYKPDRSPDQLLHHSHLCRAPLIRRVRSLCPSLVLLARGCHFVWHVLWFDLVSTLKQLCTLCCIQSFFFFFYHPFQLQCAFVGDI